MTPHFYIINYYIINIPQKKLIETEHYNAPTFELDFILKIRLDYII